MFPKIYLLKTINNFKYFSLDAAQKLYVRLFQRKYKWLRINKINYPDITQDPFITLEELVKIRLVDSGKFYFNILYLMYNLLLINSYHLK